MKTVELYPPQSEVINSGIMTTGFNCILQMPTGSGKTWLAEHAIEDTLKKGKRVIYLTPLRALASELKEKWKTRFENQNIGIYTGDYGSGGKKYPVSFQDARLMIMTPERLDACTRSWRSHWGWIPEIDLIVVDELHLLGDKNRGPRLEGALLRMFRLNPFLRVLGLSATLGNRIELSEWLDGVEYSSNWRTVPLTWRTVHYRKASDKPLLMQREVAACIESRGKSLIFVQSRRRAEQLSNFLIKNGIKSAHHHAGLKNENRSDVEKKFREGKFDAIIATGTLEMGLNLPVRQVILYDLQIFNGDDFEPLPVNNVWQRGGRAGRPGLDEYGEVVLLIPTWDRGSTKYLNGQFEAIISHLFADYALSEQIVVEVACGLCRTEQQLIKNFSNSLSKRQGKAADIQKTVSVMQKSDMLYFSEDKKKLVATRLGRIAVRQQLVPDTILFIKALLEQKKVEEFTFFDLLMIAICTKDYEPLIPADFEELDPLANELNNQRSTLLKNKKDHVVSLLKVDGKRLLSIIKTTLIARAWTQEGNEETVAETFSCYPFEIFRMKDSLYRILSACIAIVNDPEKKKKKEIEETPCLEPNDTPSLIEKLKALQHMIQHGVDEETVSLTLIKGLGGTFARRLHANGISDIEELGMSETEDLILIKGISINRAQNWIRHAEELIKNKSAFHFKEDEQKLKIIPSDWPDDIDPYRLRRSLDLSVKRKGKNGFIVTGGLEPHIVSTNQNNHSTCDCMDFGKGNICKHLLKVKSFQGSLKIKKLIAQLVSLKIQKPIDLFDLWVS